MDALAVAMVVGVTLREVTPRHTFRLAFHFGLFQALMPVIGWAAGTAVYRYIAAADHWVAFGLLTFIGAKMIYEARRFGPIEKETDPLNVYVLFGLSIATSIDALAVGLSLSFIASAIIVPVIIIGIVTFVLSFLGVYIGDHFGHFFEKKIEAAGGIILIAIGVKILIEHSV